MSDSKSFEILTAEPVRLVHSPARRVRTWSQDTKARIVAQTFAPGVNVSAIARSHAHGIDPSQVYAWRRKALASDMVAPQAVTPVKPKRAPRPCKSFATHLKRVKIFIEPEAPAGCEGLEKFLIGEDVSERLDVTPAKFRVIITHRHTPTGAATA